VAGFGLFQQTLKVIIVHVVIPIVIGIPLLFYTKLMQTSYPAATARTGSHSG